MSDTTSHNLPEIWSGFFGRDGAGPYLVGGRCSACGCVTLQVRKICPECWREQTMGEEPIGRRGTLYTYTVLHQVPPGFQAPLLVGYVDLDDGVRVFAQLAIPTSQLRPGIPLQLRVAPVKKDEKQEDLYGPVYEPAAARNGESR